MQTERSTRPSEQRTGHIPVCVPLAAACGPGAVTHECGPTAHAFRRKASPCMPVLPDKKLEQIIFAEQHAIIWGPIAASIGMTTVQVTAMANAASAARTNYDAALAARLASKGATLQADNDIRSMNTLVAEAVKRIRLFAETTNDPNVFANAQIAPPSPPTPALPPTQPIDMRAIINSMGTLSVEWKAAPASTGFDDSTTGVIYIIRRKLGSESAFSIVGTAQPTRAGKRGYSSFTDDTLPGNPGTVQYVVQAQKANKLSLASNIFSISLGFGGGGGMFVAGTSQSDSSQIQLAA